MLFRSAAALTGLLTKDDAANPQDMAPWWPECACSAAYRWADAMLRERDLSRAGQSATETRASGEKCPGRESVTRSGTRNSTPPSPCTPGDGTWLGECTITAEEREAIAHAADLLIGSRHGATLRGLLDRTQTVGK